MSTHAQRRVVPSDGYVADSRDAAPRVRRVPVPAAARALSLLSDLDYAEAFIVDVDSAQDRPAEQWARAIFEDAPESLRLALRQGWSALGYKLGSSRLDGNVLGWEVRRITPDYVLLAASSRVGMPAELLVQRKHHTLVFCVFVRHEHCLARALWAGIEPVHRLAVPRVLKQFSHRLADQEAATARLEQGASQGRP